MPPQPLPKTISSESAATAQKLRLILTMRSIERVTMLATANSDRRPKTGAPGADVPNRAAFFAGLLKIFRSVREFLLAQILSLAMLFAPIPLSGMAAETPSAISRAEEDFRTSRARFQKEHANVEAAWQFARACFDLAEFAVSDEQQEEIAKQGIEAARHANALYPDSAEGHYYLALNLGQLA